MFVLITVCLALLFLVAVMLVCLAVLFLDVTFPMRMWFLDVTVTIYRLTEHQWKKLQ